MKINFYFLLYTKKKHSLPENNTIYHTGSIKYCKMLIKAHPPPPCGEVRHSVSYMHDKTSPLNRNRK